MFQLAQCYFHKFLWHSFALYSVNMELIYHLSIKGDETSPLFIAHYTQHILQRPDAMKCICVTTGFRSRYWGKPVSHRGLTAGESI